MNLKKLKEVLVASFLLVFSFFYTNKAIEVVRNADPIMKQIKLSSSKYEVKAKNAIVMGEKIIPGVNGLEIDYEKSYQKMKKYGSYNEALTTLKEVKPAISASDYYDKYVVTTNTGKKEVALVFKIDNINDLMRISNILRNNKVTATFFIDGVILEDNALKIASLSDFEIELLNYNGSYERDFFISARNYLEDITKKEVDYCYLDYDKKEVIDLCSSLKMHTIMPSIKVEKNAYKEIKEKLRNSAIISIPSNTSVENLSSTITFLKTRAYKFLDIDSLISESIEK